MPSLTSSVLSSPLPVSVHDMARRRILLVEDDHFQRAAVIEALQDSMRRSGGIEVIWADSESKARNVVAEALRSGGVFDAYILDLMVPWSRRSGTAYG